MSGSRTVLLNAPARGSAVPAMGCAAALAILWLVLEPRTADLAAQVYRTQLFAREGFALWDNNWFGGHHLPGYSLVFPALAATFGPALVGATSVIVSTSLFATLLRDQGAGRRRAIAWFACAAAGDLFIGRLTFALGVTCALACLLAVAHRHRRVAVGLGVLTATASPVSALLLALVLTAWMPPLTRRWQLAVIAAPAASVLALSLAFPEGGTQPYYLEDALVALGVTLAVAAALPAAMRAARRGVLLYSAAIVLVYLVPSPMGSNIARLGVLAAGPLLVLGLQHRPARARRAAVAATALAIVAWQLWAPVTEVLKANDSHATGASYFAPLTAKLVTLPVGRVEVVPTSTRWESVYVANKVALARGWETQLDQRYNGLFYKPVLHVGAYVRWLRRLGVSYVALSDGPKERWGRPEARLLRRTPPELREIWRGRHWRLFAVSGSPALVTGGRLIALRSGEVTVATSRPGPVVVRVRFTRFWQAGAGVCVTRSAAGFTRIQAPRAGVYTLRAPLDLDTLLGAPAGACAPPAAQPEPSGPSR